ncbi:hypothetical protein FRC01_011067, partial [Tulasnella sp. 417]
GSTSTIIGVVGSLQVNKALPPLPYEAAPPPVRGQSLSSEDRFIGCHPPPYLLHEPPRHVSRSNTRSSKNTTLSINPPPSLGSRRTSAVSAAETWASITSTNFGTSTSSFPTFRDSGSFTTAQYYPSSARQSVLLPTHQEEPSWSASETDSENLAGSSSPAFQIAPHNYRPPKENFPAESSSFPQPPRLVSWGSDAFGFEAPPVVEKASRRPETSSVFDEDYDYPEFEDPLFREWKPLVPTVVSSNPDSSKPRLSGAPTPSTPLPAQFQAPPPPEHPPRSASRKRKRSEGHSRPHSLDLISFPPDAEQHSNKRRSPERHQILSAPSLFSDAETPSPLSPPPMYDDDTASAPPSSDVEWVYPLRLTLEELFNGGTFTYQITTHMLSGEPKIQNVLIDVMPGWAPGTQIIVPNAGNECAPGVFQTMIFVVEQVPHEKFTRRRSKLECTLDIPLFDAQNVNGRRALCRVVGLDGKVIEFYPPRRVIWHGHTTVIKGEGMYKRSQGQVVGRGDLIIRWNITP